MLEKARAAGGKDAEEEVDKLAKEGGGAGAAAHIWANAWQNRD